MLPMNPPRGFKFMVVTDKEFKYYYKENSIEKLENKKKIMEERYRKINGRRKVERNVEIKYLENRSIEFTIICWLFVFLKMILLSI